MFLALFIHRGRIIQDSYHSGSPHLFACLLVRGLPDLNWAQTLALVLRQLRVPYVHDEDEAVTHGFLPDLVLEGVIEDEDFTFLPVPEEEDMSINCLYIV